MAREDYVTDYFLKLSPLPCWKDFSPAQRRRKAHEMIADIEAKAAARRQENGQQVMGMAAVQAQNPFGRDAKWTARSHLSGRGVSEFHGIVEFRAVEPRLTPKTLIQKKTKWTTTVIREFEPESVSKSADLPIWVAP